MQIKKRPIPRPQLILWIEPIAEFIRILNWVSDVHGDQLKTCKFILICIYFCGGDSENKTCEIFGLRISATRAFGLN